jgi:hypothetical protein
MSEGPGFRSVWLPEDQQHRTGQKARVLPLRGDLHRGLTWTDRDCEAGDLLAIDSQTLPAGNYTAVLQCWAHEQDAKVGSLIAERADGQELARRELVTGDHEFGDWQRVLLSFALSAPAAVRLRFAYNGALPLWTGSLTLSRAAPRPIYIIGHNRNTPAQLNKSLDQGANALEVDLSYRGDQIMAAELPPFPGWMQTSRVSEWLASAQARRDEWAFLYLDCKLRGVPDHNFYQYGKDIVALMRAGGIPPERCLFSIPERAGVDLYRGVRDAGFAQAAFCMDGIDDNDPSPGKEADWAEAALEYRLDVVGMGRIALEIEKPLEEWWPILRSTNNARDLGRPYPRQVIFWSLHERAGIRKVLDLGVDGVIVDREDHAREVLNEPTYRQLVRLAHAGEWNPRRAFGSAP